MRPRNQAEDKFKFPLYNLYSKLTHIGVSNIDDDETILQKVMMVSFVVPFLFTGVLWGFMYYFFNEPHGRKYTHYIFNSYLFQSASFLLFQKF